MNSKGLGTWADTETRAKGIRKSWNLAGSPESQSHSDR